jgi:hypothetical protein
MRKNSTPRHIVVNFGDAGHVCDVRLSGELHARCRASLDLDADDIGTIGCLERAPFVIPRKPERPGKI